MTQPLGAAATMLPLGALDIDGNPVDVTASVAGHWAALLLFGGHW